MTTTDPKEKLAVVAGKARETAAAALDAASEAGHAVTAKAKARAAEALELVQDVAGESADAARDTLVSTGERLAKTLKAEAGATDGMPARLLSGLAGGVTTVTDGLRGRTLGDLFVDAKDYARRHPGTFAVGAAVAGFALARFLRASALRQTAEARAAQTTDRIYRDAARRSVDTQGHHQAEGPLS